MDGLGDNLKTMVDSRQDLGSLGVSRDEQDGGSSNLIGDERRRFDAVHDRHDNVGQNEVGPKGASALDRLAPVVRDFGFVTRFAKDDLQRIGDNVLVINDKNTFRPGWRVAGHKLPT